MQKRLLSFLLGLCMILGMLPVDANAANVVATGTETERNIITINSEDNCNAALTSANVHYESTQSNETGPRITKIGFEANKETAQAEIDKLRQAMGGDEVLVTRPAENNDVYVALEGLDPNKAYSLGYFQWPYWGDPVTPFPSEAKINAGEHGEKVIVVFNAGTPPQTSLELELCEDFGSTSNWQDTIVDRETIKLKRGKLVFEPGQFTPPDFCITTEASEFYPETGTAIYVEFNDDFTEIIGKPQVNGKEGQWSITEDPSTPNQYEVFDGTWFVLTATEASTTTGSSITGLYPSNGSTFDHNAADGDAAFRITFDHEVSNAGGNRPELDFSVGTLEVHRASDDQVIYQVTENPFTAATSTSVSLYGSAAPYTAVSITGITPELEYGTEYYVTMPTGFIKFADGSVSPTIGRGQWRFRTTGSSVQSYSVTYDLAGGTGDMPSECWNPGQTVTVFSTAPTKESSVFKGWFDGTKTYQPGESFSMPEHDVTLTAVWEANSSQPGIYYLTYNLGDIGPYPATGYLEGSTIDIPSEIPVKDGYVFDGWSDGSATYQPGESFTMPNHNVTLTAVWKEFVGPPTPHYTLNYNLDNGNGDIATEHYHLNEEVTVSLTIPTRLGYIFVGWSNGTTTYKPGDVFKMPNHNVTLTAVWIEEPSYLKQETSNTCTLASATMMLRRRAAIDGWVDWNYITETSVRKTAWCSAGLLNYFSYSGMTVTCEGLSSYSSAEKKEYFISMLQTHPEGIVAYRMGNGQFHAIILTDYDRVTDTFYCADPAGRTSGRVPLAQSTIKGSTQAEKLASFGKVWYIKSSSNRALVSTTISSHCPVEMRVTICGLTLDSTDIIGTGSNNYVTMSATGTGQERNVTAIVPGEHILGKSLSIELLGKGTGQMTVIIEQEYTDGTIETQAFCNVPVTETILGVADVYPQSTVILTLEDIETENQDFWVAHPNEVVSNAITDTDFEVVPDMSTPTFVPSYSTIENGTNNSTPIMYKVKLPTAKNGNITASPISASKNATITLTATPNPGYELVFLTVTDNKGSELKLTNTGNGEYTFTMPSSDVEIEAEFQLIQVAPSAEKEDVPWANPFADISKIAWYYDAVKFVSENGLMNGTGNNLFEPNSNLSRAMLAQILYNKEGQPVVDISSPFTDVTDDAWYAKAVTWTAANGIVNGYSNGLLGPNDNITREQLAVMLWRYAGEPTSSNEISFSDASQVSDFAQTAIRWAVEHGILNGKGNNILDPKGFATRAEVAQMLKNYLE